MPIKYAEARRRFEILLPESLAAEFELSLPFDPRTQRPRYGAFSRTVTRLIEEHLCSRRDEDMEAHMQAIENETE